MKGLIRHDFAVQFGGKKILFIPGVFLVAVALWFLIDESMIFFAPFLILFGGMLGLTAFNSDAYTGWSAYVAAMPLSRYRVVLARYLYMLAVQAVIVVMIAGGLAVQRVVSGTWPKGALPVILLMVDVILLYLSLEAPLLYWLGQRKGRILSLILIMAGYGVSMSVMTEVELGAMQAQLQQGWLLPLTALAVGILAVSCLLSGWIYSRKDL